MYLITYSNLILLIASFKIFLIKSIIINKVDCNMYVCMYINIVLILCMIKVRVITLGKLIGLLFLFCQPSLFCF